MLNEFIGKTRLGLSLVLVTLALLCLVVGCSDDRRRSTGGGGGGEEIPSDRDTGVPTTDGGTTTPGCTPACQDGYYCVDSACVALEDLIQPGDPELCDPLCNLNQYCSTDGQCVSLDGLAPPGSLGCADMLGCMELCMDPGCDAECYLDGTAQARSLLTVFGSCALASPCEDFECLFSYCEESLMACLDDEGGAIECSPACLPHEECVDGQCVLDGTVECTRNSHCSGDSSCVNNVCVATQQPECTNETGCDEGYRCENNVCVPDYECTLSEHCSLGERCENNHCVPDHECVRDTDCTGVQICRNNVCVQPVGGTDYCDVIYYCTLICETAACENACIAQGTLEEQGYYHEMWTCVEPCAPDYHDSCVNNCRDEIEWCLGPRGNGTGSCATNPTSTTCENCLNNAQNDCTSGTCSGKWDALGDCAYSNDCVDSEGYINDENCIYYYCNRQTAEYFHCINFQCSQYIACF